MSDDGETPPLSGQRRVVHPYSNPHLLDPHFFFFIHAGNALLLALLLHPCEALALLSNRTLLRFLTPKSLSLEIQLLII